MRPLPRPASAAHSVPLVLLFLLSGCFGGPPNGTGTVSDPSEPPEGVDPASLELVPFAENFVWPVWMTQPGGPEGDLYVVELEGKVWRMTADGTRDETPWLDNGPRVGSGGEMGLFSVAFHPDWPEDARFWTHYTNRNGDTVVSSWTASEGHDGRMTADAGSESLMLTLDQPFGNHNGGGMLFGPDGMLYVALGDGGGAHDPEGTGQDPTDLLGSILRLDIDATPEEGKAYAVPSDNPFVAGEGADEVWHFGLRNPWRFSFDRATGAMWIGDVGQNEVEEVDRAAPDEGGLNFGWNTWEGDQRHRPGGTEGEATFPVAVYPLIEGRCAVTGGFVYRGDAIPALEGVYVFGDYCTGEVWGVKESGDEGLFEDDGSAGSGWSLFGLMDVDFALPSFAEDASGELYLLDRDGTVWKLVAAGDGGQADQADAESGDDPGAMGA